MMEDKPEKPDLPTLSRKAYLTWNEVDGLLFHYAYKRNAHGNYKWQESLKNARKGVRDLFEEALLLSTGELKGESLTRGNTPIYQKIKKGELCAWLMGKRILDLLKDKGIEVLTENVNFGIKASTVRQFLVSSGLPSKKAERTKDIPSEEVAEIAKNQALMVMCLQ